jgi:hypothetical protein
MKALPAILVASRRNLTDKPVRFLIVFAGQKGTPNLVRP